MMQKKLINLKMPRMDIGGEVKYILYDKDQYGNLTVAEERDWTSNTILDNGLIIFTTLSNPFWFTEGSIGSDGSATNPVQTTLGTELFTTSDTQTSLRDSGNEGSPDYEYWHLTVYRFDAGEGDGTIREFGVGAGASGTNLFARHVVTPEINKSPTQVLDVYYRLTQWPPLTPVLGTTLIGGVNYDTSTSFYNVDQNPPAAVVQYLMNTADNNQRVYDGIAATLTENQPQGSVSISNTDGFNSTSGSGVRAVGYKLNLNDGVTATEKVRTAVSITTYNGNFQTQFTATDGPDIGGGIPKTLSDELTLNWSLTWGRRP